MIKSIRTELMEYLESSEKGETIRKEMAKSLVDKAISGDVRAFEAVAKFIGEFPSKREMVDTDAEIEKSSLRFL
jgi:hypothetical protein